MSDGADGVPIGNDQTVEDLCEDAEEAFQDMLEGNDDEGDNGDE